MNSTFNPLALQGTKHYTVRETSTGLYPEVWIECDRNLIGDITLWPVGLVNQFSMQKKLVDLLTLEQLQARLISSDKLHPICYILLPQ